MSARNPLQFQLIKQCSTTKARVGVMSLVHGDVNTPVFMPVGTKVKSFANNCKPYPDLKFFSSSREQ